jgi:hypothetical protein
MQIVADRFSEEIFCSFRIQSFLDIESGTNKCPNQNICITGTVPYAAKILGIVEHFVIEL